jgi:RNase adaptor protein for sRNA GlmZ degradation
MRKVKVVKPVLIKVGKHFINPVDVSAIREVKIKQKVEEDYEEYQDDEDVVFTGRKEGYRKKTMFVIDMKSNPNPTYAIWVEKDDIEILLEQFNIKE